MKIEKLIYHIKSGREKETHTNKNDSIDFDDRKYHSMVALYINV